MAGSCCTATRDPQRLQVLQPLGGGPRELGYILGRRVLFDPDGGQGGKGQVNQASTHRRPPTMPEYPRLGKLDRRRA